MGEAVPSLDLPLVRTVPPVCDLTQLPPVDRHAMALHWHEQAGADVLPHPDQPINRWRIAQEFHVLEPSTLNIRQMSQVTEVTIPFESVELALDLVE